VSPQELREIEVRIHPEVRAHPRAQAREAPVRSLKVALVKA